MNGMPPPCWPGGRRRRVEGAVAHQSIPARTDRVGLPRIDVAVNGQAVEAMFDTGSSLSVLSAATARRLGVTVIDGESRVGNGVQGTVAVRLGIADRLEIAGTILRNVPFLIIDDSQLTFPIPGGYEISAIIGVPVMRVLGRMRMEPAAGRFTVLPPDEAPSAQPNLVAGADQIFVDGRDRRPGGAAPLRYRRQPQQPQPPSTPRPIPLVSPRSPPARRARRARAAPPAAGSRPGATRL